MEQSDAPVVFAAAPLRPLWRPRARPGAYGPLDRDLTVDVVVIGAGITGLTLALRLKRGGLRVAVLEMRSVGTGATGHTSGHLATSLDTGYATLVGRFGTAGATEAAQKSVAAVAFIEATVAAHAIACDFRRVDGWRFSESADGGRALEEEARVAATLGLAVEYTESVPLPFARAGVRFRDQAQFHALDYVTALAGLVHGDGSFVFEETPADRVVDGSPCRVEVGPHVVTGEHVVHATHTPLGVVLPLQARISPYMSYVIAVRLDGPVPSGLFWDDADPYHYLRPVQLPEGGEALLVGGEDHKTGQEPHTLARFAALEAYARARFPVATVDWRWAWEVFEPVDGLPYIGRLGTHRGIWGATGFGGNGLTSGTAAGIDIAAQILTPEEGRSPSVFRPQRYKPFASAGTFLRENANVAWRMIRDRVDSITAANVEGVKPGQGALVLVEGHKCAVYRSPDGNLHTISPVCPHAGGIVQWNEAARTWDCPLHGSRFHPLGHVLAGPAAQALLSAPDALGTGEECSISDLLTTLSERGYTCDLQPVAGGRVRCPACDVDSPASAGRIEAFHRFEGMSDPDDMCVVVAMRLPRAEGAGDCRGVLVLGFGPKASADEKATFASLKFDPTAHTSPC